VIAPGQDTRSWCIAIALAFVTNMLPSIFPTAQARWVSKYADAPYRGWFAQQRDGDGWSCCDLSDAHPIYDAYIKDRKWHVLIDGIHYEIQPQQLLKGPNPTGHAIIWYGGSGDHVTIFCFAPGPLY